MIEVYMRILFCADTNIQKEITIGKQLLEITQSEVDVTVCNLEGFLVEGEADTNTMSISYKHFKDFADKMKIKYVSLANNHINDHGKKGRELTIRLLKKMGIDYFGTKEKPFILLNNELALLGSVWKLTGGNQTGLNSFWFNLKRQLNIVNKLNEKYKVIWFPHWGIDMECLPHPWQREASMKMIEAGVDIIYGSHPHLIHPYEVINDKMVFYSCATMVMPKNKITYYLPNETGNGIFVSFDSNKGSNHETIYTVYNNFKTNTISIVTNKISFLQGEFDYDAYFSEKRNKKKLPVYKKKYFCYNFLFSFYPLFLSFLFRFDFVRNTRKKLRSLCLKKS